MRRLRIHGRASEGRERAMARGVVMGRKPKLTQHQRQEALARRDAGEALVDIGRSYNVSHSTIGRLEVKVGKTTARSFAGRIQELVKGHRHLETIGEALLSVRTVLLREFNVFEKRVRSMARSDARTRLLMTTPAVGPIVALTYASAIDDPARFKSSKQTGAHFGLTPKKYQSGETDYSGRISKIGDASVREALYQAAHVMLTKPVKGCSQLKSWAMRIARRAGSSKAKVALARKLAVILHRMLANATPFNAAAAAA